MDHAKETLDYSTNSHCQHLGKYIVDAIENVDNDVRG